MLAYPKAFAQKEKPPKTLGVMQGISPIKNCRIYRKTYRYAFLYKEFVKHFYLLN